MQYDATTMRVLLNLLSKCLIINSLDITAACLCKLPAQGPSASMDVWRRFLCFFPGGVQSVFTPYRSTARIGCAFSERRKRGDCTN